MYASPAANRSRACCPDVDDPPCPCRGRWGCCRGAAQDGEGQAEATAGRLYSDTFQRLAKAAGLPAIRLHDARHTFVTLMILNNVSVPVVSKWHGHASAAFTMNNYAHSQDDALAAAGALLGSVIRKSQDGVKLS